MNEEPTALCPYCNAVLVKHPTRKSKCPHCSKPIFVKKTPDNREKRLMTADQAADAERQWDAYNQKQSLKKISESLGLTHEQIDGMDLVEALETIAETGTAYQRKIAFSQLAIEDDRNDKDFSEHLKQSKRYQLLECAESGEAWVTIVANDRRTCSCCKEQHGRVLSIKEAMQEMPLPHPGCTNSLLGDRTGFCRCYYESRLEDEL